MVYFLVLLWVSQHHMSTEFTKIIKNAYKSKEEAPRNNSKKRFVFESKKNLTKKEKSKIYNSILAKERQEKTISEIAEIIKNWDYEKFPKLNKSNVFKVRGKGRGSVDKYFEKAISISKMENLL